MRRDRPDEQAVGLPGPIPELSLRASLCGSEAEPGTSRFGVLSQIEILGLPSKHRDPSVCSGPGRPMLYGGAL